MTLRELFVNCSNINSETVFRIRGSEGLEFIIDDYLNMLDAEVDFFTIDNEDNVVSIFFTDSEIKEEIERRALYKGYFDVEYWYYKDDINLGVPYLFEDEESKRYVIVFRFEFGVKAYILEDNLKPNVEIVNVKDYKEKKFKLIPFE